MEFSPETLLGEGYYKVENQFYDIFAAKICEKSAEINKVIRLDITTDCFVFNPSSDEAFDVEADNTTQSVDPTTNPLELKDFFDYLDSIYDDEDVNPLAEGLQNSGLVVVGSMGYLYVSLTFINEELQEVALPDVLPDITRAQQLASKYFWYAVYYGRKQAKTPGRQNARENFFRNFGIDPFVNYVDDSQARAIFQQNPNGVFNGIRWVVLNKFRKPLFFADYRQTAEDHHRGATRVLLFDVSASMWRYVHDLSVLNIPRNFRFCNPCGVFHHNRLKRCWKTLGGLTFADHYKRFEKPPALQVFYGDFEAYNTVTSQEISGVCIMENDGSEPYLDDSLEPIEYGHAIMEWIKARIPNAPVHVDQEGPCCICNRSDEHCNYYHTTSHNCLTTGTTFCENHWRHCAGAIPLYFHNSTSYDMAHLYKIFLPLYEQDELDRMQFIAKSINRVETVELPIPGTEYYLVIRDSVKQLGSSLAQLANIYAPHAPKGAFPYDWFDSLEKLNHAQLPQPGPAWDNKLTNTRIDGEEAHRVFNEQGFTSVREYHNWYLRQDVDILRIAMERLRALLITEKGVDPCRFNGMPATAWYDCRKGMGEHEARNCSLPTDQQFWYSLFWGNIRGGITNCIKRAQAAQVGQIIYLDVNGLYGSVLKDFKYPIGNTLTREPLVRLEVFMQHYVHGPYGMEHDHGFAAVVDIEFPVEVHDEQQLPLCETKHNGGLLNSFEPITAQLHGYNRIRQMIQHGLKITKVHDIFTWQHERKFKNFTEDSIARRNIARAAGDEGASLAWKLSMNGIYGKTIEKAEKYKEYKLRTIGDIAPEEDVTLLHRRNLLNTSSNRGEQIVATISTPEEIRVQNSPWDGFMVLEYSKERFYDGVHTFLRFPNTELLYCDTDSVILYNKDNDFYNKLKASTDIIVEDKTYGKWQLEHPPHKIKEFLGVSQKAYHLTFDDNTTDKRHKGISRRANLTREMYFNCIFNYEAITADEVQLRLVLDTVSIKHFKKIALTSKNPKRIILADKINSIPYGYRGVRYADNRQPDLTRDLVRDTPRNS